MSTTIIERAPGSWGDMVTRERAEIEAAAQQQSRSEDAARRAATLTVGIVDVAKLMRDLAFYAPATLSDAEREGYLQAVRDISCHINQATLEHNSDGELVERYVGINVPTEIVDKAYRSRLADDSRLV